ncbi:MAG: hypothetical protein ACRD82_06065 [Blastocatellia bacterium]
MRCIIQNSLGKTVWVRFCALALLLAASLISAQAQTTAFSYQGQTG